MHCNFLGVVIILSLFSPNEGKIFKNNCELVQALRPFNLPNDLQNWVCLIVHESARNTKAINKHNKNGSIDYGLFQINSRYWCRKTYAGGDCVKMCQDFIKDDITDAVNCAKKIYKRHGFNAWYGWRNHCQGKELPDITNC